MFSPIPPKSRISCRNVLPLLFGIALAALLTACAASVSANWREQLGASCPTSAELGKFTPWDKLELRVFGQEELSGTYEVSARGTITVPTLGEIGVAGMRCDELEVTLTAMLKNAYLRDPSVVCINKEISKTAVTVDGQVQKPGIVEFRPGLMLTDVIAQSGGPTNRASVGAVVIVRKKDNQTQSVNVPYQDILMGKAQNVCLHPADLVYVPQSVF